MTLAVHATDVDKGHRMSEETAKPFNDLIAAVVGPGKAMTVREFSDRAVDPKSGYRPSKSLIGNIIKGQSPQPSPELISAVAAGLGRARAVVEDAAIQQWIRVGRVAGHPVYHDAEVSTDDMPLTESAIERVKGGTHGADESNGP
jgi:hypothetical protein